METKKGGDLKKIGFLSSNCVGISTVVCGSSWGLKEFKMAVVTMVTKVQNGRQLQKSSDLGEIWFPSRL
jgi:hypothetical protein